MWRQQFLSWTMGVEMSAIKSQLYNNKGFASIEATVLLVLFVSLIYYTFGFFGVVHTGILHNIHARTYAFETFRHRANLMYFRSNRVGNRALHYFAYNSRLHGINTDTTDSASQQVATERAISMGLALEEQGRRQNVHIQDIQNRVPAGRNSAVSVNPVWIMTAYGICLESNCGD